MTAGAAEDTLKKLLDSGTPQRCLDHLAGLSHEERRQLAPVALKQYRATDKAWMDSYGESNSRRKALDKKLENTRVAVFATATRSELKKLGWQAVPNDGLAYDVIATLQPDWTDGWVSDILDAVPQMYTTVRRLYDAGLCTKPTTESYILGMIEALPGWRSHGPSPWPKDATLAERIRTSPDIRDDDVWRLFTVEGGGEISLANYDKYIGGKKTGGWADALVALSDDGTLERERLLDASLDTLSRDFAQYRAGWFSRLHEQLAPTLDERAARLGQYLALLSSAIAPTVSFALKALKVLDKADELPAQQLLEHIGPVFQARAKGTVIFGLQLLERAIKRSPAIAHAAARTAADALIHEAADVQRRTLQLIAASGFAAEPDLQTALRSYADGIAPSVRAQFVDLTGGDATAPQDARVNDTAARSDVEPIHPIASFDELHLALLAAIEDASDPLTIERTIAGFAEFGAAKPADFDRAVSPLAKRARTIVERESMDGLQYQMAQLALAYATGNYSAAGTDVALPDARIGKYSPDDDYGHCSFERVFLTRSRELLQQVGDGHRLPLLSAPTDTRGFVAPAALATRYAQYVTNDVRPGDTDMALALLRLAPEERTETLALIQRGNEYWDALAYALGENIEIGATGWLWVAAAAARLPYVDQPRIAARHGRDIPDAGKKAEYSIGLTHPYFPWRDITVTPHMTDPLPENYLASLFHMTTGSLAVYGSVCGHHVNMIRWSATVWPLNLQPFFSQGVLVFDEYSRLTNSPYAGFLEPMLSAHVEIGAMGAWKLLLGLASNDPAVKSVAKDAAIAAVTENRVSAQDVAVPLGALLTSERLPARRWTKALTEISQVSKQHVVFVRELIAGSLQHDPTTAPRDMGGLLELLYECSVATDTPVSNADALTYLRGVTGGGKLKRFAGKLLAQSQS